MAAPGSTLPRFQRRPSGASSEPAPSGRRRRAILSALAITLTTAVGWWALQLTAAPSSTETSSAPGASSDPDERPSTESALPDVQWQPFAGLPLPVSAIFGPQCLVDGRAACFTNDPRGAAFAAVNLLVRTFPFAGSAVFGPTIQDQVVGRHKQALARLTTQAYDQTARAAGVTGGAPIQAEGGWIAGYRAERSSDPDTARIQVLIRQSDDGGISGFTEYTVSLAWRDGDWRLVAPAWGDWRSSARAMNQADPAQYRGYDQTGRP